MWLPASHGGRSRCGWGGPQSRVSRELARNGGRGCYRAQAADAAALGRALRPKAAKLVLRWSPEQIAGWLPLASPSDPVMRVPHETIAKRLAQGRGQLRDTLHISQRPPGGGRPGRTWVWEVPTTPPTTSRSRTCGPACSSRPPPSPTPRAVATPSTSRSRLGTGPPRTRPCAMPTHRSPNSATSSGWSGTRWTDGSRRTRRSTPTRAIPTPASTSWRAHARCGSRGWCWPPRPTPGCCSRRACRRAGRSPGWSPSTTRRSTCSSTTSPSSGR